MSTFSGSKIVSTFSGSTYRSVVKSVMGKDMVVSAIPFQSHTTWPLSSNNSFIYVAFLPFANAMKAVFVQHSSSFIHVMSVKKALRFVATKLSS